jgi:hypothetical protein
MKNGSGKIKRQVELYILCPWMKQFHLPLDFPAAILHIDLVSM